MKIEVDEDLIKSVRRLNAKINGAIGGAAKSVRKTRAVTKNAKRAVRARKMQLAAA